VQFLGGQPLSFPPPLLLNLFSVNPSLDTHGHFAILFLQSFGLVIPRGEAHSWHPLLLWFPRPFYSPSFSLFKILPLGACQCPPPARFSHVDFFFWTHFLFPLRRQGNAAFVFGLALAQFLSSVGCTPTLPPLSFLPPILWRTGRGTPLVTPHLGALIGSFNGQMSLFPLLDFFAPRFFPFFLSYVVLREIPQGVPPLFSLLPPLFPELTLSLTSFYQCRKQGSDPVLKDPVFLTFTYCFHGATPLFFFHISVSSLRHLRTFLLL